MMLFLLIHVIGYYLAIAAWWLGTKGQVPLSNYLSVDFPVSVIMIGSYVALVSGFWILLPFVFGLVMRTRWSIHWAVMGLFPFALALFWLLYKQDPKIPVTGAAYPAFGFAACAAIGSLVGLVVANRKTRAAN